MNAMTQAGLLATTSISTTAFVSDDDLIRICAGHQRLASLVNTDPTPEDIHDAYRVSCDAIHAAQPASLRAIIAKARAAMAEACVMGKGEIPDEGWAPDWAWHVVRDLLRLADGDLDAELIALCAEFDVVDGQLSTINGTGPDCIADDAEADTASAPLRARLHVLLDRMDELRATTPAGIQARAYTLALHAGHDEYTFDCATTIVGRLLRMLMRDSAALGTAPTPVSTDTELISACEQYLGMQRRFEAYFLALPGDIGPDDPGHAILEPMPGLLDTIARLRATTMEGYYARARAAAFHYQPSNSDCQDVPDGAENRIEAANLRDLVQAERGGGPRALATHPDAELLDKVAAFFAARGARPVSTGAETVFGTPECEVYETSLEAYFATESDLLKAALAIPARTMLGLKAKARLVKSWDEHEEHVDGLLTDILEWAAVA